MVYIIMPAFNVEKYIKKAIKSVLNQSYKDWKLIIVDDGSTDNTFSICSHYERKDSRIKIIHKKNQGLFLARMTGINYCKKIANDNDFVTFIDSDDMFFSKSAISTLISQVDDEIDIIVGSSKKFLYYSRINFSNFNLSSKVYTREEILSKLYLSFYGRYTGMPSNVWSKLYRFSTIKDIPDYENHPYFFAEDQFINLVAFSFARKIKTIEDIVYAYRFGGGTTKFMPSFIDDMLFMYDFRKSLLAKLAISQDALLYMRIEYKNVLYYWLCLCLNKGNYSDDEMLAEIEKCLKLEQTNDAFSDARVINMEHFENQKKFITFVIQQKPEEILSILKCEPKPPTLLQRAIKKIFG